MADIHTTEGIYKPFQFGLKGVDAVKQRIRIITSTVLGTCVMDREFGVDDVGQDLTTLGARQLMIAMVITAINEQEPAVEIQEVDIVEDADFEKTGRLVPIIRFTINEDGEGGNV
ncbi:GPW/gp25 family protein [Paenibacillus polymyxa]|uniref:GPW/gp25 family protein n=1 Tax=Paenibacillus polymyxa TaxID=1406 RepID=UPI002AB55075|nr:GPW/gp25 family protein [Paenibacillus polymyxa]MDY7990693.1 GPW/gp25 family protein [Paenibacillus polymyxa]MDY8117495.1 GPW/gp25 family protein [Paenibacillus polymyxa]